MTKADVAAGCARWFFAQPTGPGAPFRFLFQEEPTLKREFDALSRADQDDVFRAIDLMISMPPHATVRKMNPIPVYRQLVAAFCVSLSPDFRAVVLAAFDDMAQASATPAPVAFLNARVDAWAAIVAALGFEGGEPDADADVVHAVEEQVKRDESASAQLAEIREALGGIPGYLTDVAHDVVASRDAARQGEASAREDRRVAELTIRDCLAQIPGADPEDDITIRVGELVCERDAALKTLREVRNALPEDGATNDLARDVAKAVADLAFLCDVEAGLQEQVVALQGDVRRARTDADEIKRFAYEAGNDAVGNWEARIREAFDLPAGHEGDLVSLLREKFDAATAMGGGVQQNKGKVYDPAVGTGALLATVEPPVVKAGEDKPVATPPPGTLNLEGLESIDTKIKREEGQRATAVTKMLDDVGPLPVVVAERPPVTMEALFQLLDREVKEGPKGSNGRAAELLGGHHLDRANAALGRWNAAHRENLLLLVKPEEKREYRAQVNKRVIETLKATPKRKEGAPE